MIGAQDISDAAVSLVVAGVIGTTSFIGWLVRRALTNQKQIEMLANTINERDQLSADRNEALHRRIDEIHTDVREIRQQSQGKANQ
jgi:cytochrome P450